MYGSSIYNERTGESSAPVRRTRIHGVPPTAAATASPTKKARRDQPAISTELHVCTVDPDAVYLNVRAERQDHTRDVPCCEVLRVGDDELRTRLGDVVGHADEV